MSLSLADLKATEHAMVEEILIVVENFRESRDRSPEALAQHRAHVASLREDLGDIRRQIAATTA